MTSWKSKLAFAGLSVFFIVTTGACTNRTTKTFPQVFTDNSTQYTVQTVADFQYQGKDSTNYTLETFRGRMFATGTQYGIMAVDVSSTPEDPPLVLDILTRGIEPFSSIGGWVLGFLASKATAFSGDYMITSGTQGASAIRVFGSNAPREEARFAASTSNDPNDYTKFQWEAAVAHPTLKRIYGFGRDNLFEIDTTSMPNLRVVNTYAYSANGPVCCPQRAVIIGNRIFVAMRSKLWTIGIKSNGELNTSDITENNSLQAVDITATSRFIYIHHRQATTGSSMLSTGMYLFTLAGQSVRYLPFDPAGKVSVAPDDSTMYSPNATNTAIDITKIFWTN